MGEFLASGLWDIMAPQTVYFGTVACVSCGQCHANKHAYRHVA